MVIFGIVFKFFFKIIRGIIIKIIFGERYVIIWNLFKFMYFSFIGKINLFDILVLLFVKSLM